MARLLRNTLRLKSSATWVYGALASGKYKQLLALNQVER